MSQQEQQMQNRAETERQYAFMEEAKKLVAGEAQKVGHDLTCAVITFGCQMNARDSEKLEGILKKVGFTCVDSEDADFVIYNTCTVRDNANQRVYGRLGVLNGMKRRNPHKKIALCGCMMQEEHVVKKIKESYRFVDIVFGTHNIYLLSELLWKRFYSGKMVVDIWDKAQQIVEDLPSCRDYSFKSGVNIMYGCNNFCSYCIVPYVRGRERSRKPEDIIAEVKKLADEGVVEVMLLGQNVNSYGKTLEQPISFAELLKMVEEVDGIKRIRFMTPHPKDLSEELIQVMKYSKKICRQMHLPLQSGSTAILKDMNRRYTKEQYLALVERIKQEIPDVSLSTDIIVGYPGETEEDFQDTIDVVRKVQYDSAFTFIYSKRTGTPAAAQENQVPDDVVKERFSRLLQEISLASAACLKKHLGKTMEVLVEEMSSEDGIVTGRLSNNTLVHFAGDRTLIGKTVNVKLEEDKGFYYIGTQIN